MGKGGGGGHGRRRNEEKNDHGSIHPQSKELWCVPKAGLTVAVDSGHWQGRGGINSERREGNRVGKDGPAQPSPACPGPRTQDPRDACCTVGVAGRQADSQSVRPSRVRQAGRRCRFAMREVGEGQRNWERIGTPRTG